MLNKPIERTHPYCQSHGSLIDSNGFGFKVKSDGRLRLQLRERPVFKPFNQSGLSNRIVAEQQDLELRNGWFKAHWGHDDYTRGELESVKGDGEGL